MSSIHDQDLGKNAANFVPLSPVSFVERSADVFGDLCAVIHGQRRHTWRETRDRSARLAAALTALGVGHGGTVSAMLPNSPEMVEAHYAVPALGAVLNTRQDVPPLAWQMNHCETKVLITDREFAPKVGRALRLLREEHGRSMVVVDVCDGEYIGTGERLGALGYESWLAAHEPVSSWIGPRDEWDAIAMRYTSGTTGDPKRLREGITHTVRGMVAGAAPPAAMIEVTMMGAAGTDHEKMALAPADGQTVGEIVFRDNIMMKGYVKIKHRSEDIIISGGENISSLEVDDALYPHAAVMACAVVARPDAKWGETPPAFVELQPGASLTASELVAHCKGLLAVYKVPREIRFEPIPKTSTGKIQKFTLRERAKEYSA